MVEMYAMQKIIQSYLGDEFIGKTQCGLFAKLEIIYRLSCPGTLKPNRLAERKHRHVVETGLTWLSHSSLDSSFGNYTFSTAIYLIKRLPTPTLHNKSPFEVLFWNSTQLFYNILSYDLFGFISTYTKLFCTTWLDLGARYQVLLL